tara:strand:- start:25 stop:222 length:198 start_codon:yes stop_codon:yes gene_type:complete
MTTPKPEPVQMFFLVLFIYLLKKNKFSLKKNAQISAMKERRFLKTEQNYWFLFQEIKPLVIRREK